MKSSVQAFAAILIAGTLAGFLSGLILPLVLGIRGAAFGFCLSLTIEMVHRYRWKPFVFLPGILLGIIFMFFPVHLFSELGLGARGFDFVSLINCAITIPALAYAYLSQSWKQRIWKMLAVGLFSSLLRSLSLEMSWNGLAMVLFNFPIGTLPFLLLWLLAMKLTDPSLTSRKQGAESAPTT